MTPVSSAAKNNLERNSLFSDLFSKSITHLLYRLLTSSHNILISILLKATANIRVKNSFSYDYALDYLTNLCW